MDERGDEGAGSEPAGGRQCNDAGSGDAARHLRARAQLAGRGARDCGGAFRGRCWLVDLPHHGNSGPGRHGDTVHGLAQDVLDWAAVNHVSLRVVLGHSYGGKVALAMAERLPGVPLQVWVIRLDTRRESAVRQRVADAPGGPRPAGTVRLA